MIFNMLKKTRKKKSRNYKKTYKKIKLRTFRKKNKKCKKITKRQKIQKNKIKYKLPLLKKGGSSAVQKQNSTIMNQIYLKWPKEKAKFYRIEKIKTLFFPIVSNGDRTFFLQKEQEILKEKAPVFKDNFILNSTSPYLNSLITSLMLLMGMPPFCCWCGIPFTRRGSTRDKKVKKIVDPNNQMNSMVTLEHVCASTHQVDGKPNNMWSNLAFSCPNCNNNHKFDDKDFELNCNEIIKIKGVDLLKPTPIHRINKIKKLFCPCLESNQNVSVLMKKLKIWTDDFNKDTKKQKHNLPQEKLNTFKKKIINPSIIDNWKKIILNPSLTAVNERGLESKAPVNATPRQYNPSGKLFVPLNARKSNYYAQTGNMHQTQMMQHPPPPPPHHFRGATAHIAHMPHYIPTGNMYPQPPHHFFAQQNADAKTYIKRVRKPLPIIKNNK